MDYLYGYYPVLEAIKTGRRKTYQLFLDKKIKGTKREEEFCLLASEKNIPVKYLSQEALERLCSSSQNQQIVLKASSLPCFSLTELLKMRKKKNFWVGLHRLQNQQNVGSILRNCVYFNIFNVFTSSYQSCPLSAAVSKSSAGAMEKVNFGIPMNFNLLIEKLKKNNFWIIGTSLDGEDFSNQEIPDNCFLIFGNEKKGIQPLIQKKCDFLWKIEGGGINSLNVASSSAIIFHYIYHHQK